MDAAVLEALLEAAYLAPEQVASRYAWLDQRDSDWLKLRSKAQRVVKEAFDNAGIVMPEPIYNINLRRRPVGAGPAAAKPGKPIEPNVEPTDVKVPLMLKTAPPTWGSAGRRAGAGRPAPGPYWP